MKIDARIEDADTVRVAVKGTMDPASVVRLRELLASVAADDPLQVILAFNGVIVPSDPRATINGEIWASCRAGSLIVLTTDDALVDFLVATQLAPAFVIRCPARSSAP